MNTTQNHSWQSIQQEISRRIAERIWLPGELIPNEVVLAEEFGCARATVNRAMRELASTGLLERKRKAGTPRRTQSSAKGDFGNFHHPTGS